MQAHLHPVPTPPAEEGEVVEPLVFEEFYEGTHPRLFIALCLVTGNRHDAEEIMQDAFIRVFERWDRVATLDDPEAYLYTAAMNVFRNRYRRARMAVQRSLSTRLDADDLAAVEARDEVVRLLKGLAPRERAAIVLTQILDLPTEEAGRMLGIKASTIRVLTMRARAHLRAKAVELP